MVIDPSAIFAIIYAEPEELIFIQLINEAKLNMGDCFSYALAKSTNQPLLFKGNDFIHTDIEQANY